MLLWRNDRFVELCIKYANDILPLVCPCLYNTGMSHWNSGIKNLAVSVIRMCMETVNQEDSAAFNATIQKNDEDAKAQIQRKKQIWIEIENQAFENCPEMKEQQQR